MMRAGRGKVPVTIDHDEQTSIKPGHILLTRIFELSKFHADVFARLLTLHKMSDVLHLGDQIGGRSLEQIRIVSA